jgi:hypothetical protein
MLEGRVVMEVLRLQVVTNAFLRFLLTYIYVPVGVTTGISLVESKQGF